MKGRSGIRRQGRLSAWDDERGFGFIMPSEGGDRVFVHISDFARLGRRPQVSDRVLYTLGSDAQGRRRALMATLVGDVRSNRGCSADLPWAAIGAAAFLALVGALVLGAVLPHEILIASLVMSALTYIAYARDKSAARSGARRVAESGLHLLALAGGWPGALLAQQRLRHKTRKRSFRAPFWLTVALNLAGLTWLILIGWQGPESG